MRDKLIKLLLESDIKDKYDAADKADEILDLFNVVAMLPSDDEIEKAAEENASRLYATDSCQDTEWYATHHGFMDGADFVRNKLSGN